MQKETLELLKTASVTNCFATRTPFAKSQQNRLPVLSFLLLFVLFNLGLLVQLILGDWDRNLCLLAVFGAPVFFFFYQSWQREPGYCPASNVENFLVLCQKKKPHELCFDCQNVKVERSKHCILCDRCINEFDHHCPWINNCVGLQNRKVFFWFIFLLLCYLVAASVIFFCKLGPLQNIVKGHAL